MFKPGQHRGSGIRREQIVIGNGRRNLVAVEFGIESKSEKVKALGLSNSSTNQDKTIVAVELLSGSPNEQRRDANDCIDYKNWMAKNQSIDR